MKFFPRPKSGDFKGGVTLNVFLLIWQKFGDAEKGLSSNQMRVSHS
jgi:hypothetical protein